MRLALNERVFVYNHQQIMPDTLAIARTRNGCIRCPFLVFLFFMHFRALEWKLEIMMFVQGTEVIKVSYTSIWNNAKQAYDTPTLFRETLDSPLQIIPTPLTSGTWFSYCRRFYLYRAFNVRYFNPTSYFITFPFNTTGGYHSIRRLVLDLCVTVTFWGGPNTEEKTKTRF